MVAQAVRMLPDLWLSWWMRDYWAVPDTIWYIWVYACVLAAMLFAFTLRNLLFTVWNVGAARNLHDVVFKRVLRAPMRYFDQTPLGRILNRFTKDMDAIDDQLPASFGNMLHYLVQLLATVALIAYVFPWFLIAIAIALVIFVAIGHFYSPTSRQLKRLDSVTRSPLFSQLSSTLSGLVTIRAYGVQSQFRTENERRLDRNTEAFFYFEMAARWLVIRMEWLCAFLVAGVALCMVLTPDMAPSTAALALTYTMSVAQTMAQLIRVYVDSENQFTSVERLAYYVTSLDQEADVATPHGMISSDWPSEGRVEFERVEARYTAATRPVISELSFKTKPAEKIGIGIFSHTWSLCIAIAHQ